MADEQYDNYLYQDALQERELQTRYAMDPNIQRSIQENQAVLVEQTNPSKVIDRIINVLKGVKNIDGREVQFRNPKLNKEGLEEVEFILESHINQGGILSHLDEREIVKMMTVLRDDLTDAFALNWRIYGIQKKTDLDIILDAILFNVFYALKRAEGQNEKNWLGKISIENISGGHRPMPPKKSSWLDKFRL